MSKIKDFAADVNREKYIECTNRKVQEHDEWAIESLEHIKRFANEDSNKTVVYVPVTIFTGVSVLIDKDKIEDINSAEIQHTIAKQISEGIDEDDKILTSIPQILIDKIEVHDVPEEVIKEHINGEE